MSDITLDDIKKAYYTKPNNVKLTLCYSGRNVLIRQMKMKDKKEILKTFDKDNDEEIIDTCIDKIIEKYVEDDESNQIKPGSLLEEERQQLFMELRKNATSSEFMTITRNCPKCNHAQVVKFPFSGIITTNYVKPENISDVIVSQNGNVSITIGHLNRSDIIETRKYIKDNNIISDVDKQFISIASSIKQIDVRENDVNRTHIPTLVEKLTFLDNMVLDDFEKIAPYFKGTPYFGSKAKFNFKCENKDCNFAKEDEEVQLVDFFIN